MPPDAQYYRAEKLVAQLHWLIGGRYVAGDHHPTFGCCFLQWGRLVLLFDTVTGRYESFAVMPRHKPLPADEPPRWYDR